MLVLLAAAVTLAYEDGIGNRTEDGCGNCHGAVADASTTLEWVVDDVTIAPGEVLSMAVIVRTTSAARDFAGVDIHPDDGDIVAGSNNRQDGDDVVHAEPQEMEDGAVSFDFTWTAPTAEGTVTFAAAGNAVDGNGRSSGDGWNLAETLEITVDSTCVDEDGDGVEACDGDCDDGESGVYPGAVEIADGIDQDCDGVVDEGTEVYDDDGDGFSELDGDCDDSDAAISPTAVEVCDALDLDEDCNGLADDGDPGVTGTTTFYEDRDGDGWGDAPREACRQPDGYSELGGDCDDADPRTYPSAPEACGTPLDLNCDGFTGNGDADGDGWPACTECDDGDPEVNPAAHEACNGKDDDCDGVVDPSTSFDASDWYLDADGDGWGAGEVYRSCSPPDGYVAQTGDCDDDDASAFPGGDETWYDGVDGDCDGESDLDQDGDGHDAREWGGDDCDDLSFSVHPGARETWYDGIDQDCDGNDLDFDGDGFNHGEDCDDADAGVTDPCVALAPPGESPTEEEPATCATGAGAAGWVGVVVGVLQIMSRRGLHRLATRG